MKQVITKMNRQILLLLIIMGGLLLYGCATATGRPLFKEVILEKRKATVHFYQYSQAGGAYDLKINGGNILPLQNKGYYLLILDPGTYVFTVSHKSTQYAEQIFTLLANREYYINFSTDAVHEPGPFGGTTVGYGITSVPWYKAVEVLQKCRLIAGGEKGSENKGIFTNVNSIGVLTTRDIPEAKLLMPTTGLLDGAKKGAIAGAEIGAAFLRGAAPQSLEGVVIALLFVSAFGAVGGTAGAVEVAIMADKPAVVREQEAAIRKAVAEMQMQEKMQNAFWLIRDRAASFKFVPIDYAGLDTLTGALNYRYLKDMGVDVVQELTVTEFGLKGYGIAQPVLSAYVVLRCRLIRSEDNVEIFKHDYRCTGSGNRFASWAENGAELLRNELDTCYGHLASEVITNIYLPSP